MYQYGYLYPFAIDGDHGRQWILAVRCTGLYQLFCESVHLRVTLRSLQTLSEADGEQELCHCGKRWLKVAYA